MPPRHRLVVAHPELGAVEIVTIRTTGDRVQDRLLAEIGAAYGSNAARRTSAHRQGGRIDYDVLIPLCHGP